MKTSEELKSLVKEKYAEIAMAEKGTNQASCCGAGGCSTEVYNIMTDDYANIEGYQSDADLGLGCGLPTEFASIKPGDVVVDLGSGAGNDCFVARHETGADGRVIGIDFTPAMIEKAKQNAEKLGFSNVEFRLGDIESLPLSAKMADVVVSNCVLNLVPDKTKAFAEIFRVLKAGGHFSISDIVLDGSIPEKIRTAAEMYAGCVSGAMQRNEYLKIIQDLGFEHITIQKSKPIVIPDDILKMYLLSEEELAAFKRNPSPINSITVFARKRKCCGPESSCCN
jgi:SAM-dependent methyltransferase